MPKKSNYSRPAIAIGMLFCSAAHSSDIAGVLRIDAGTEYVFRYIPSTIGGTCKGWNTVSIQRPGQPTTAMNNLMCWKERSGNLYTATAKEEGKTVVPMSAIR